MKISYLILFLLLFLSNTVYAEGLIGEAVDFDILELNDPYILESTKGYEISNIQLKANLNEPGAFITISSSSDIDISNVVIDCRDNPLTALHISNSTNVIIKNSLFIFCDTAIKIDNSEVYLYHNVFLHNGNNVLGTPQGVCYRCRVGEDYDNIGENHEDCDYDYQKELSLGSNITTEDFIHNNKNIGLSSVNYAPSFSSMLYYTNVKVNNSGLIIPFNDIMESNFIAGPWSYDLRQCSDIDKRVTNYKKTLSLILENVLNYFKGDKISKIASIPHEYKKVLVINQQTQDDMCSGRYTLPIEMDNFQEPYTAFAAISYVISEVEQLANKCMDDIRQGVDDSFIETEKLTIAMYNIDTILQGGTPKSLPKADVSNETLKKNLPLCQVIFNKIGEKIQQFPEFSVNTSSYIRFESYCHDAVNSMSAKMKDLSIIYITGKSEDEYTRKILSKLADIKNSLSIIKEVTISLTKEIAEMTSRSPAPYDDAANVNSQ